MPVPSQTAPMGNLAQAFGLTGQDIAQGLLGLGNRWANWGGLAGALGMADPVREMVAAREQQKQAMQGGDLLSALVAGTANPMAGAIGPADLASPLIGAMVKVKAYHGRPVLDVTRDLARQSPDAIKQAAASGRWYHSTTGDFEQFSPRLGGVKLMDGLGSHFGTAKAAEERLAKNSGKGVVEGANIRPVQLDLRNPLTKKNGDPFTEAELQSYLAKIAKQKGYGDARLRGSQFSQVSRDAQRAVKQQLLREGYDGILYINSHEDRGSISAIVFRPGE